MQGQEGEVFEEAMTDILPNLWTCVCESKNAVRRGHRGRGQTNPIQLVNQKVGYSPLGLAVVKNVKRRA